MVVFIWCMACGGTAIHPNKPSGTFSGELRKVPPISIIYHERIPFSPRSNARTYHPFSDTGTKHHAVRIFASPDCE